MLCDVVACGVLACLLVCGVCDVVLQSLVLLLLLRRAMCVGVV